MTSTLRKAVIKKPTARSLAALELLSGCQTANRSVGECWRIKSSRCGRGASYGPRRGTSPLEYHVNGARPPAVLVLLAHKEAFDRTGQPGLQLMAVRAAPNNDP